jgi:hypothetical protein
MRTWLYTDAERSMSCIGDRLTQAKPPLEVVPLETVRLEFFPWLESTTAPRFPEALHRLLSDPAVRARMSTLGFRYLLELRGGTKSGESSGGAWACGMGCFGFEYLSRESSFSVYVLDLLKDTESRDVTVTKRGGIYIPAFILPLPLLAPTRSGACQELAERLHERLTGAAP